MGAQITLIAINLIGLLIAANQHNKPKEGKHNFFVTAVSMVISMAILYWGGFFNVFLK